MTDNATPIVMENQNEDPTVCKEVALIDFEYGGVKFREGEQVPESFARHLRAFGGMHLDVAVLAPSGVYPHSSTPASHPIYPPHSDNDAQGDRCVCGGIRYWHAVEPHGCDDCDCASFLRSPRHRVVRVTGGES